MDDGVWKYLCAGDNGDDSTCGCIDDDWVDLWLSAVMGPPSVVPFVSSVEIPNVTKSLINCCVEIKLKPFVAADCRLMDGWFEYMLLPYPS